MSPVFTNHHNKFKIDVGMEYKARDIIEYIVAVISEFAAKYSLTDKQAYRYINFHKWISFLEENYGIIHTLDFDEAVDSVAMYCRRTGGEL